MELPVETFRSALKRALPPIEGLGSVVFSVPRALDESITSGSVQNARELVREAELRHRAEAALRAQLPLGNIRRSAGN
ncbi:MAG: hypothetical protein ACRDKB_01785 [Actinomycetota bacterium]